MAAYTLTLESGTDPLNCSYLVYETVNAHMSRSLLELWVAAQRDAHIAKYGRESYMGQAFTQALAAERATYVTQAAYRCATYTFVGDDGLTYRAVARLAI